MYSCTRTCGRRRSRAESIRTWHSKQVPARVRLERIELHVSEDPVFYAASKKRSPSKEKQVTALLKGQARRWTPPKILTEEHGQHRRRRSVEDRTSVTLLAGLPGAYQHQNSTVMRLATVLRTQAELEVSAAIQIEQFHCRHRLFDNALLTEASTLPSQHYMYRQNLIRAFICSKPLQE